MTHEKIFDLKFKQGLSTQELLRQFPREVEKVLEVALLQIPTSLLRKIISDAKTLEKVLTLKQKFFLGKKN